MTAPKIACRRAGRVLIGLCWLLLAATGSAAADPATTRQSENLQALQSRVAAEKARAAALEAKAGDLEKTLSRSRAALVSVAGRVREAEKRLGEVDRRIEGLETEQTDIESRIARDRAAIADLLLALERLHRTPPEALMLRPGAPIDAARSAMLMRGILPPLQSRAAALRKDLARLEIIRVSLNGIREKARADLADLKLRRTEMTALMAERETLYGKARREQAGQKEALRRISLQARSLQDLIAGLEANEEKRRRIESAALLRTPETPMPQAGSALLPVSGILRIRYGEPDPLGAASKGLSIDGMAGGVVVAPMGGVVRYAGPFRGFGNIVIVEHEKGFHSLVAGLGKIDTVEGRSVTAGEPIGSLPGPGKNKERPTLYYELRHKGKPVDPSRKFADLG